MALRELPPGYQDGFPRRNVDLKGAVASAFFGQTRDQNMLVLDPDDPFRDPNELLKELGTMLSENIDEVNFNCPLCHLTMSWPLFEAHALKCMRRWYKTMDISQRRFTGATIEEPKSVSIQGETARGDSGAR